MKKTEPTAAWRRLELVIDASGMPINAFARALGLRRGENLYQIRKGNHGISRKLAERIHAQYPQYPVAWLLCGESETVAGSGQDQPAVRIPVYGTLPVTPYSSQARPDSFLILSAAEAGGAQLAVTGPSGMFGVAGSTTLALLREPQKEFEEGRLYYVVTHRLRLLRRVFRERHTPQRLRLLGGFGTQEDEVVVRCDDVLALWPLCGVVCRLE